MVIAIVIIVLLALLFTGAMLGREAMERQRRILRMKRFRREVRARTVEFDEEDKLTTTHEH